MWGKLNQMVSGDQQKIEGLEAQLEEEHQRNKTINDQFKKVLKEKEKEIQKLKANAGTLAEGDSTNGVTDDREEMREELIKLQRKVEEYEMLNTQKDENVKVLMQQVTEAEEIKDKVEAQERINSEKLMFELAGRIDSHEKISNKLEEVKAVLAQKDVTLTELADEMAAKDQMLKGKDDAIKKLRVLSNASATEELIESLEKSSAEKERKIGELRRNITHLEDERGRFTTGKSNVGAIKNKDIESFMEKIKQRDDTIEMLLQEKEEMNNKLKALDEEHVKFIEDAQQKDNTISALKSLTNKLESESQTLHSNIAENGNEIESLQKLLEESEREAASLERENKNLSLEYASKIDDFEKLHERLELSQLEATSFKDKYDAEVTHSSILMEQLDNLGKELSQQTEIKSKEKENAKEQDKELNELKDSVVSLKNESTALHQRTQELESVNEDLHTEKEQFKNKIKQLEITLETSQSENQLKKTEVERIISELDSTKQKLDISSNNEQTLCDQITQLHTDNDHLNKSMVDLEATILQLDGDMNTYKANVHKYKLQQDELEEGLLKANEEKEGSKSEIREMEEMLKELAESSNCRRKSKEEHYNDLKENYREGVEEENMQTTARSDNNMLNKVIQILEDERFELEQLLKIAIKQKDDFMEKNSQLEALLLSEKEKFDKVLERSSKLQAELSEKGEEKNALSFKLEEEITSLQALLKATEEQCRDSSEKEMEMKECVDLLKKDLAQKEEEIINLQENSAELQNMLEDATLASQEEKSTLEAKVSNLESQNEELEKINYDKVAECSNLRETLSNEYKVKTELQNSRNILEEEKSSYQRSYITQEGKIAELMEINEKTNAECQERGLEIDRLLFTLKDKETKESCVHEHLQTKEADIQTLGNKLREVEENFVSSQEDYHKLKEEFSLKQEDFRVITEDLRSKEEAVRLLSEQVEYLNHENNCIKKNESSMDMKIHKLEEDIKILQGQNDCFVALSNTEALKGDKLTEENTKLNVELIQRNAEVESLRSTLNGKEIEIHGLTESLRLKETYAEKLDSDLQEVERDYYSLKEENTSLQKNMSEKEDAIALMNSNLTSKEDSVTSLYNKIELFKQEVECMKKNECALNLAMKNNMEQIDVITLNLNSKEESVKVLAEEVAELKKERDDLKETLSERERKLESSDALRQQQDIVTERLKEELNNTELEYQHDLREAENIYNDLQKQFETSRESEAALQVLLTKKNEEIDELLAERKAMIFKNDEEKSELKASLFSQEESHHDKMEEKDRDYEMRLEEKNMQIQNLNESVCDLEDSLKQSNDTCKESVETLWKKEKELLTQIKGLEQSLHNKGEELLMVIQVKNSFDDLLDQSNCEVDGLRKSLALKEVDVKAIESDLNASREREAEMIAINDEKDIEIKKLSEELGVVAEEKIMLSAALAENENELLTTTSHLEALINEKDSDMNDLNTSISQKEEMIMNLQSLVQSTNNEQTLQTQQVIAALAEKENELLTTTSHLKALINEKDSDLNDLNTSISQKEEMIMNLQNLVQSTNNEQALQTQQVISEKEEMKANLLSIIKEKEESNVELNVLINYKDNVIADIQGQLEDVCNKNKEEKETEWSLHQSDLETLQKEVEVSKISIAKLQQRLNVNGEEKQVLQEVMLEKDELIFNLQANLQENHQTVELLQSNSESLEGSHAISIETINDLNKKLSDKDKEIDSVKANTSKNIEDLDKKLRDANSTVTELKEKYISVEKENIEYKNVVNEISLKDKEISNLNEALSTQLNQYGTLKEKTARSLKKSQAMKKVIAEKEKEIEVLKDKIASSGNQLLQEEREITILRNDIEILHSENENNRNLMKTQADELEGYKTACQDKDNQLNELNYVMSQRNQANYSQASGSIDGSAPSETSVLAATNDLEWDPSACINKSQVDEPVCAYLEDSFNEAARNISEIQVFRPAKEGDVSAEPDVEKSENQKLIAEVQQLNEMLNKSRKKNALLQKAQIELAKEIEVLQELPNKMELEVINVREELSASHEQLNLSENFKREAERQIVELQQLILVVLGEDEWKEDDIAVIMDKILETKEEKAEIDKLKDIQQQFANLQGVYSRLSGEFENMTLDWQGLQNQKLEKEKMIEVLNQECDKLKLLNRNQSEIFLRSVADIFYAAEGENDVELLISHLSCEEAVEETKTLIQNLKSVKNKLKKEKRDLLEQLQSEKLVYANKCEEEKMEALRELQINIEKESNQEIELLKGELNLIVERQVNADNLREQESSLKENALHELELLREQLATTISEQQLAREVSQECESKLLEEIERELSEVKEKLKISNATKDNLEAALQCEELLKQQIVKENDILKSELNVFKEEHQQVSDMPSNLEEVKKHKDLVIKKLKLKLRKELSEKEVLKNSLTEAMKFSETVNEKEEAIRQLTDTISTISEEKEELTFESMKQISEKDDLTKALKDELSWLKDSMEPLITKADNADKLHRENQGLKHCIESKDDEVVYLRENALMKENELTYLIDQEKQVQDEYIAEIDKLKIENEDKKQSIKTMRDEIQWLQTQLDEMSPKSDQLAFALNDLNTLKENLSKEMLLRKELESQVHIFKETISEKANINDNLQGHCQILQTKLDNMLSNKEEVEEMNSSFKELEELCSSKDEEIAQVNESLQTREVQLEDLKTDLLEKTGAYEELQGMLQNKDIENHQVTTLLNQEKQASFEKDLKIKESADDVTRLTKQVASLNDELSQVDQLLANEMQKYDNISKEVETMTKMNSQLKETEDHQRLDFDQLNQSLREKDVKLDEFESENSNHISELRRLSEMVDDKSLEIQMILETCESLREIGSQNDALIGELKYQLEYKEDTISQLDSKCGDINEELQHKNIAIDELTTKVCSFEQLDSQYQKSSKMNLDQQEELLEIKECLQIKDLDLEKVQQELHDKLLEVEQLNVTLQEKDNVILKDNKHMEEQNSRWKMEQESICHINNNLTSLLMQFGENIVPPDNMEKDVTIEIRQNAVPEDEQGDKECPIEKVKKIIESKHEELALLRDLVKGKQNETDALIVKNSDLLKHMECTKQEYETNISKLQETISEKDALFNNSLQQVKMVKELLDESEGDAANDTPRNMQALDYVDIGPDQQDSGWDDVCGWENIENLESENVQGKVDDDTDVRKEIEDLKEEKVKLSEMCDHKDMVITRLKNKVRQVIVEKDTLKEKCQGIEHLSQEVHTLKGATETLKNDNGAKETTIAKLKSKLKQTMRGRDQLKENLQSELDRISQEKDLIFNEFSEKLQQQNKEVSDLRNGSEVLSKTLESLEETLVQKEEALQKLQSSLDMKNEICKKTDNVYSEVKVKCDELENEKTAWTLVIKEKDNMLEKYEIENSEKKMKISDLQLELEKFKNDKKDFDEITSIMEETMGVKDQSLEKLRQQLENLQQEYVKLNSDYQVALNKHQTSAAEYEEIITALNEKLTLFQEQKEDMAIKAGEYKAELEAVEILTGFSNENTSLLEQVGSWQLQTTNKIKEYQRQVKDKCLEDSNIHSLLQNIEKLCDISSDEDTTIRERLKKIQNRVHKLKEPKKRKDEEENLGQVQDKQDRSNLEIMGLVGDAAGDREADDINVTYQLLDNKIKALTALTQELQKKMLTLDGAGASAESEGDSSYLRVSPAVIEEIELIKSQLEKDISYSKTEWIHLQSENSNLKRQVNLLGNFADDPTTKGGSNLEDVIVKKNAALLELQKSFEVVIGQKDVVIDSLRKRIGDLRDQLLTARSPVDQLSKSKLVEKERESLKLNKSAVDVDAKIPSPSDYGDLASETSTCEPIDNVARKELDAVLKMNENDNNKIRCIQLKKEMTSLQNKLAESIDLHTVKDGLIEKNNSTIVTLQSQLSSQADVNSLNQDLQGKINAASEQTSCLQKEKESLEEMLRQCNEEYSSSKVTAQEEYKNLVQRLQDTTELLESKINYLKECSDELKEKTSECNDIIEENLDYKEEIADLKETLHEEYVGGDTNNSSSHFKEQINHLETVAGEYRKEIENLNENLVSLESSKSSLEAELREAETVISMKDNETNLLSSKLQEATAQLQIAPCATIQDAIVKEELVRSNSIKEDELVLLRLENTNLKKQMDVLTSIDNIPHGNESALQGEISRKNEAFSELRSSFEGVIEQKDSVIDSLRKSVNKYRDQNLKIPQQFEEELKQFRKLLAEKDRSISETAKQIDDIRNENTSLKKKLVIEKKNIDGRFENISVGLRNDLELALKEKKQYSADVEIHCLQLEKYLNAANDELSESNERLKLQEILITEKNTVISSLQNQVGESASKMGYKFLQEQVVEANKTITGLSKGKDDLVAELSYLKETQESLKLEVEVVTNEKNEIKLEANSHIEDILIKNAEEIEDIRNTFGESLSENDAQISQLIKSLADKEEESHAALQLREVKLKEMEEAYTKRIKELEMQLDAMVNEKEKRIKEIAVDAEIRKCEEITNFEKDINDLLSAKDEKINHVSSQLEESQLKCTEMNKIIEQKGQNIATLGNTVKSLKNKISSLKETNRKLDDAKANDIKETIITKGKQLKDLREEFETVFDEKNNIIESIRATLKTSRTELVQTQEKLRHSNENNRNLEQQIVEVETEKLEVEEKLSCLLRIQTSSDPYVLKGQQESVKNISEEVKRNILENERQLKTVENDFAIAKKTEEMGQRLATINDIVKDVQDMNFPNDSLSSLCDRVKQVVDRYTDTCNYSKQLGESIAEKDKEIEDRNNDLANFRNESTTFQSILETVNSITENIPGFDYYDDSLGGVKEKVEQLVNNLSSSQKYCDELSKKLYELMEQKSVQDFSSQCEDEGKEVKLKKFEERISYLQRELYESVSEKESTEEVVREKYDDILENLREDLDESKKGYKLLQEENFSLRNQLDVYTNVTIKRLHSRQASDASSASATVEEPSPKLKEGSLQKHETLDAASEIETAELKTTIGKLKKLCRKYKAETQSQKNELCLRNEEVSNLNAKLSTSTELSSDKRIRYEQEIKNLREDISALVVEKEEMVESFKSRNESDLLQMKEAYQMSLTKLNHDIQMKDNSIEKYECEIELLKVNLAESNSNGYDNTDTPSCKDEAGGLSNTANITENEITQLKKEKDDYQRQVNSYREVISEFVQEKENSVTLWESKLEGVLEGKDVLLNQLRSEIALLNKKLVQSVPGDVEMLDSEVPQPILSQQGILAGVNVNEEYCIAKEPQMNEDTKKLHLSLLQHFPASSEEINILRIENKEKDMQLQDYRDAISELESKIVNEREITNSLSQEITDLKSEKLGLEDRFQRVFQQQIKDVVNKNNLLRLELTTNKFEQLKNEDDNSDNATLIHSNELKSQVSTLSNEKAELILRIMTLRSMLEQEVKEHEKTRNNKSQIVQNQYVMRSGYSSLKSTASNLNYIIKSIRSELLNRNLIMKQSYKEFFTTVLPSMISEDYEHLKSDIQEKDDELLRKEALISNARHEKKLAESRLFDVVCALQELGAIEKVQAKLLEKESSLKNLHKFAVNESDDIEELKQRLLEKDNLIAEYEEKVLMLEDKIHIWRGQYLSDDQLRGVSPSGTQASRISELIDWPDSDQGSVVSEIGSMVSMESRRSVAPSTPTMDRN